ncbi:hypothetical protein Tsp_06438 [Trichinella spiralis]|uniref:hypothetical protein n=1 Tax=Trichinella spiralis TaxID=6334 RepID=UPI0001EFC4D1|nr:hypothetical protein Tsp_06438 [Trichinella spiralis]
MLQLSAKLSEPSWYGFRLLDTANHTRSFLLKCVSFAWRSCRHFCRRCCPLGFLLRRVFNLHVQRQPQLSAEHGDRRCHPRALVNAAVVRQHDKRQHEVPLVRVFTDHDGQHIEERSVETLRLSIPLRMVREDRVFLMQNKRLISIINDASNERH